MHLPSNSCHGHSESSSSSNPVELSLYSLNSTLSTELDFSNQLGSQNPAVVSVSSLDHSSASLYGYSSRKTSSHAYSRCSSASKCIDDSAASTCSTRRLSVDSHQFSDSVQHSSHYNLILDSLPWIVGIIWMIQIWINSHDEIGR